MTPEKFLEEMQRIARIQDPEISHIEADELMCKQLRTLGYGDAVDEFIEMPKWYA